MVLCELPHTELRFIGDMLEFISPPKLVLASLVIGYVLAKGS
jgi:hypothetical protein